MNRNTTPASCESIVADYLDLLRRAPVAPEISAPVISDALPVIDASRPCAVLLSPHPDDEALMGAWALRLRQEKNWQIVNIAVTLGGKLERREARRAELAKSCAVLEFDGALPVAGGFTSVNETTRATDAPAWQKMAARVAAIIAHCKPRALFLPHLHDANATHGGVHWLGMDALALMPNDFTCAVAQTEYWHPLAAPNTMIAINGQDAARLMAALACHAGEVARNPYDIRFPAWLIDNVRRGSERIGGKGVAAAPFDFATLYHVGLWRGGRLFPSALNRIIGGREDVSSPFE